jgi:lipid-binding SYLF domain-containing protein
MKQNKLVMFSLAALAAIPLAAQTDTEKRLQEAREVMQEIMATPDRSIPQELLNKAECIVIVPGLKKGAFIVGGKYGRGFVSCRHEGQPGWSKPGGVRVEGGSFGFQIGGAETDVVMLVMNRRGMEKLLTSKFTLGGDASVAAGPLGRDTSAQTDALMHAEILTWSRQRGVFAGIALTGATLRQDDEANEQMYGRNVSNRQIVDGQAPAARTRAVATLVSTLNKYSSRK